MATHPPQNRPPGPRPGIGRPTWAWAVAAIVVAIGLPATWATKQSGWLDGSTTHPASPDAPDWLNLPTVHAMSADGEGVRARVALDVPDSATRALINREPAQVALLMQISVSEHDRGNAQGSERVQRLADDMRKRLNRFLAASDVPPVRDVVVQDLVFSKP